MNGPSGFEEGLSQVELEARARALPDRVRNAHRDPDAVKKAIEAAKKKNK